MERWGHTARERAALHQFFILEPGANLGKEQTMEHTITLTDEELLSLRKMVYWWLEDASEQHPEFCARNSIAYKLLKA